MRISDWSSDVCSSDLRRAADSVSGFADTLRTKDVDELLDDARALVRKSPVIAIGTAAAIGFALVRLVKAGLAEGQGDHPGTPHDIDPSPTHTKPGTGRKLCPGESRIRTTPSPAPPARHSPLRDATYP